MVLVVIKAMELPHSPGLLSQVLWCRGWRGAGSCGVYCFVVLSKLPHYPPRRPIDLPLCSLRHLVGYEREMQEGCTSASVHVSLYHTEILREVIEDSQVPLWGLAVSDGAYVYADP